MKFVKSVKSSLTSKSNLKQFNAVQLLWITSPSASVKEIREIRFINICLRRLMDLFFVKVTNCSVRRKSCIPSCMEFFIFWPIKIKILENRHTLLEFRNNKCYKNISPILKLFSCIGIKRWGERNRIVVVVVVVVTELVNSAKENRL